MKRLVMTATGRKKALPTLVLLALVALGGACRKQPAAVEIKGPILGMTTATGFDDKGTPQNPSFAFAPTEPQLVVIVQVGRLDGGTSQVGTSGAPWIQLETVAAAAAEPVVNIEWYHTSDEGEQKLFEHQVKVQSYDRAYSIGKSKGTLKAGSYKVKATLAGQTQETELQIQPAKTESSSSASSQVSVNQASAGGNGNDARPGEPPVAGESGTIPESSGAGAANNNPLSDESPFMAGCNYRIEVWEGEQDLRANTGDFFVYIDCPNTGEYKGAAVSAKIEGGALNVVGRIEEGFAGVGFAVNPCPLENGKDLPGTRIQVEVHGNSGTGRPGYGIITLGPDKDAPKVSVNSSPTKGTKVKAGDVIKIDATASERRSGGTWQTGIQLFQLIGPDGKITDKMAPSRLPQACGNKSWSMVLAASYTVPQNPPPVIKLCAIADDFAGNQGIKCGEFPTGDVWKGTLRTEAQASFDPGGPHPYACSSVFDTTLELVVNAGGEVSGHGRGVYVSSTCSRKTPPFSFVTFGLKGRAYSDRLEFYFGEGEVVFVPPPPHSVNWGLGAGLARWEQQGQPATQPFVVPITAPGIAKGQSTARWDSSINHYASTDTIRLDCETCAPGVASNSGHQRRVLRYPGTVSGRFALSTTP